MVTETIETIQYAQERKSLVIALEWGMINIKGGKGQKKNSKEPKGGQKENELRIITRKILGVGSKTNSNLIALGTNTGC